MNVVELQGVTKVYQLGKTQVTALRKVNLSVFQGEFLVIKGQSGSGKSTILNIIGGMDIASSGKVIISGKDVSSLNDGQLSKMRRNQIGFIFQSFNLIPVLNALENVAYPLRLQGAVSYREKAEEALCRVGLKDFMKHRPNELSGGQIQRVAIARGTVSEPDIVLADEPTANLDSENSQQILNLMLELNQEKKLTFILNSHHSSVMERASRIVEIKDGKIQGNSQES